MMKHIQLLGTNLRNQRWSEWTLPLLLALFLQLSSVNRRYSSEWNHLNHNISNNCFKIWHWKKKQTRFSFSYFTKVPGPECPTTSPTSDSTLYDEEALEEIEINWRCFHCMNRVCTKDALSWHVSTYFLLCTYCGPGSHRTKTFVSKPNKPASFRGGELETFKVCLLKHVNCTLIETSVWPSCCIQLKQEEEAMESELEAGPIHSSLRSTPELDATQGFS